MKLILAIINFDDANAVTHALTKKGFSSTKLATTGGFLMAGNVTILVGVDEEKVQAVIDIIKEHSHKMCIRDSIDLIAVTGQSLVDGIVYDLIHQMMETGGRGGTDIHAGPLADGL